MEWYKKAADAGDKRATKRIQTGSRSAALDRRLEIEAMKDENIKGGKDGKESCLIMWEYLDGLVSKYVGWAVGGTIHGLRTGISDW
jgi:hypothetical protein